MVPLIPPPEGWAFPGAPEFVHQGPYQSEFNVYTDRPLAKDTALPPRYSKFNGF